MDEERRLTAELIDPIASPFHGHHGSFVPALGEAEPGDLQRRIARGIEEAIEIRVEQRPARGLVFLHERERGAGHGDVARNAEGAREGSDQERLAGAELAVEDDEVSRREGRGDARPRRRRAAGGSSSAIKADGAAYAASAEHEPAGAAGDPATSPTSSTSTRSRSRPRKYVPAPRSALLFPPRVKNAPMPAWPAEVIGASMNAYRAPPSR